jgi:hypothetical protein
MYMVDMATMANGSKITVMSSVQKKDHGRDERSHEAAPYER